MLRVPVKVLKAGPGQICTVSNLLGMQHCSPQRALIPYQSYVGPYMTGTVSVPVPLREKSPLCAGMA